MRDTVIVSTSRTPISKAYRCAFNNFEALSLAAPAVRAALVRAGLSSGKVEKKIFDSALTQGTSGVNVACHNVQAAGLPDSVAGARMAGHILLEGRRRGGEMGRRFHVLRRRTWCGWTVRNTLKAC